MRRPLRPLDLLLVSVAALATTACSPPPSKNAPSAPVAVEVVDAPAAASASGTPVAPQAPAKAVPELIRALAAAPQGLSVTSGEGARLSAFLYGPDDCADLGPDSEGPELPFDRYCVWPRDPNGGGRLEVLTGIVSDRIVSVALIGHSGALPGWDCTRAPTAQNTELCVATGTGADQKAEWNTAWNTFVTVFVNRS
ncbi:MAG: hypothetical protein JHC81_04660 [Brevundimonas sp.]|uniref:hypothetical protein n=1 Tax=Brevundimonas sp. TaxID=1871086 RepID=UPI001A2F0447|nr:hypothetical protein [Brevundimonas sp.]MBJ7446805.1 hypothetical protein [Brevundimonas sp.]